MKQTWERSRFALRTSLTAVFLILLSFVMYPDLLPYNSFAEPGVAANPSISITPSGSANLTLVPGAFGSVSQTITSTTTNYTGYTLTISTSGTSTNLVNTENSSLTLPTITLGSGQSSITSSNFTNNTYGYSLNGTDYKPAPALNEEDVIITTNAANNNADTTTLTFGAVVDLTAVPGTYQNTFLLSATANDVGYMVSYVANANGDTVTGMPSPNPEPEPTSGLSVSLSDAEPERDGYRFMGWAEDSEASEPEYAPGDELALDPETANITTLYAVWKKLYTIVYNGNDADGGSMNMVYHEDVVEGDTVNLYASNFDRTGYGFLGWSFDEDAAETIGTYNASRIYGPNEEITAPDYVDNEYSTNDNLVMPLFAIWLESSGDIQDWAGCNSMSTGDVVALTDTRDNNTYAISKLSDGNCWMMENMRLSLDSVTINGNNTNNPTEYFATTYSGSTSLQWSSWGSSYWNYRYNNNNINRSLTPSPTNNDDNSSWYSYGVYYSWMTAMAGWTVELTGDLCPSGWRLPTSSEMTSFISNQLNGTRAEKAKNILKYPINYLLSGSYDYLHTEITNGWTFVIQGRGEYSQYAVSNAKGSYDYNDYATYILSNDVYVGSGYAYKGKAIKCRSKDIVNATLTYDANGGTGAPEPAAAIPGTGHFTYTVSSITPTRSGYTFSGWADKNGIEVLPNGTFITIDQNSTLYAIWTKDICNTNATTINTGNNATDAVCLQDMNTTVKSNMTSKETYTLIDSRDNKEYTVSLLDDNNVWMTKNLELGDGTDMLLTSYDTDLSSGTTFELSASNYIANSTVGNYYTWYASVASFADNSGQITTSICPLGWDLPTNTQYTNLQSAANFSTNNSPYSPPYSFIIEGGFYYSNNNIYNTNNSYLWTSMGTYNSNAWGANIIDSVISQTSNTGTSSTAGADKTAKRNLRCIANNGNITLTYHGNGSVDYPVTSPTTIERTVSYNEGKVVGNSFVRNHYTFKSWNTNANGTGSTISTGATVLSLSGRYNLYAQWTPNLTVIYHSNDVNQSTNEYDYKSGTSWRSLNYDAFTPATTNMKISSWNTMPDGSGTTYNHLTYYTASSSMTEPETLDLYAQWSQTYSFTYNGNGADEGSMTSAIQNNISVGDNIGLIAPNYSKTGYGFVGWSLDSNAVANSNYTIYGPNETIEVTNSIISNNVNGVVTFYAVWIAPSGTFQQFNDSDYTNSPNGTVLALRDERDDNIYTIAKLADGNWWMTENLKLQLAAYGQTADNKTIVGAKSITDGTVNEITPLNTNNPKNIFLNASDFAEDWKRIGNITSYNQNEVEQINVGLGNINRDNEASYDNTSTNMWGEHQDKSWYSYGVMYNWFTATAGNGLWEGVTNTNVEGSICPLGWRLPSGNTGGDVANLKTFTNSFTSYPINIIKSGLFETGPTNSSHSYSVSDYYPASYDRGINSYYWTSTFSNSGVNTKSSAYTMTSSGTSSASKVVGAAIRCVANNNTTYTINYNLNGGETGPTTQTFENSTGYTEHISNTTPTRTGYTFTSWIDKDGNTLSPNDTYIASNPSVTLYALWTDTFCNPDATTIGTGNTSTDAVCLQDMNLDIKNNMILKETYSLIDKRDGKTYNVSLLDDNNVWLTSNLAFGDNEEKLLMPSDTDIYDGLFIFPASEETFVTNNYTTPQIYIDETYGHYYSWAAAIASTKAYNSSGVNPPSSVCPAHWNLPTINLYQNLASYAGLNQTSKFTAAPYNFTLSGLLSQSSFSNQGTNIYLWTSTVKTNGSYSDPTYYSMIYGTSNGYSASLNTYKYNGVPVRCVLSNGTMTIHYDKNDSAEYPSPGTLPDQVDVEIDVAKTYSHSSSTYIYRQGFTFRGWNTKSDGSGIAVATDDNLYKYGFQNGDEITLYAQWDPSYTIIYHSNDANNSTTTSIHYRGNNLTTRSSTTFTSISGDTKIGFWSTSPDGTGTIYYPNTQYPVPSNITIPTTIDLYAQWTSLYTVVYDGNGADAGVMTNVTHINAGIGDRITLFASNYSKDGYGFAGWSFDSNATVNSNSVIYGPNEKALITTDTAANNVNGVITIYAVWVAPSGTMQDFDCSALNNNEVVALTDTRDKDVYTVAKYIDDANGGSNCWMMENLRLDNTYEENGDTVTVVMDSNNTQGFNGVFTTLADPESQNFSSTTTSNSLYSTSNITGSYQSYRFPRYNNSNTASRSTDPTVTDNRLTTSTYTLSDPLYSYGNYYTWAAAAADTSYYYTSIETNITGSSICPKGWHLPTAGANGEYTNLIAINDTLSLSNYPLNFVKSGSYSGTTQSNVGTYGYYWSSTIPSYSYSSKAFYYTSQLTISSLSKYIGYSVRCIADTPAPEPDPESSAPEEATTESSTDDTIVVDLGEVEKAENPENKEEIKINEDFSKETEQNNEISS